MKLDNLCGMITLFDSFHLPFLHAKFPILNYVAEEVNFIHSKRAIFLFDVESNLSQDFEYKLLMLNMLFKSSAIANMIIKKDHKFFQVRVKNIIFEDAKCSWCASEAKEHYQKLVCAIMSNTSSL